MHKKTKKINYWFLPHSPKNGCNLNDFNLKSYSVLQNSKNNHEYQQHKKVWIHILTQILSLSSLWDQSGSFSLPLRDLGGGRQERVIWVFILFYWEPHCFLTTVWKQARMPHDSMTQPCCSPLSLALDCACACTHTQIRPTYKQNSHDAKQKNCTPHANRW